MNKKVSVVLGTRNDGYGDEAEKRFIFSINSMLENYDEVVVTDWNSPGPMTMIESVQEYITKTGRLKEVVVTEDDLRSLGYNTVIPISEVHCRNIAMRRSSHTIILSSNPDVVPVSPITFPVEDDRIYITRRRDTWDFKNYSLLEFEEFYNHVKANIYSWEEKPLIPNNSGDKWSKVVCCGDFQLASRNFWFKIRGFEEGMPFRSYSDTNVQLKAHIYGAGVQFSGATICHLNHSSHNMIVGGQEFLNDDRKWVYEFTETENDDQWGAPDYKFEERVW